MVVISSFHLTQKSAIERLKIRARDIMSENWPMVLYPGNDVVHVDFKSKIILERNVAVGSGVFHSSLVWTLAES